MGNDNLDDPSVEHEPPEAAHVNALDRLDDDGTLFDRWLSERDGDAFALLAQRHSTVVFDIACRVLGDRGRAEDVLQEALLDLALEPTRKPIDVGVPAWLVRFTICRARNVRSSERSRSRRQIVVGLERPEVAMPDDSLVHNDELEAALAGCDPEDRALLAMRYLHGWDYDRISAALSIQSGAARVRVHRALRAVRARAGTASDTAASDTAASDSDAALRGRLAVLPIASLPAVNLDASIRSVVEIAKVRLGAPANGIEHATAASRSFRLAVTLAGTALVFVGVTGATAVTEFETGRVDRTVGARSDAERGTAYDTAYAPISRAVSSPAPVAAGFRGIPRPAFWDHGTFGRAGQDVSVDPPLPSSSDRSGDSSARAPAVEPAPAARPGAAPAAPEFAPPLAAPRAAAPSPDAARASAPQDESPSALRPTVRGACAAKGDPVSSDDERAGALGDSADPADPVDAPAAAVDAAAVDAVVAAPTPSNTLQAKTTQRVTWTTVPVDQLPGETLDLLDQAEDLVRGLLVGDSAADPAADPETASAPRTRLRSVRKVYGRLAKKAAPGRATTSHAAKRLRAQTVRQVLTLLTQVVLSDGRLAGELRWPAGADVNVALQEVIRILGTRAASGPAGADPGAAAVPAADRQPSGATDAP